MIHIIKEGLVSLLLPACCCSCQLPLEQVAGPPLCPACLRGLPRPESRGRLGHQKRAWEAALSPYRYEGAVQSMILELKYKRRLALASFLGHAMAETVSKGIRIDSIDAVVPVPLHRTRLRERTFNQAEAIARLMAKQLGLPCQTRWLIRTHATAAQTGLARGQRRANVESAFALQSTRGLASAQLILVDDVLTTGSTSEACVRTLKRGGACKVIVVTAAYGS